MFIIATVYKLICGVMVSVFTSSVINLEFKSRSGQTIHYKIGVCCFSANHAALRSKTKNWLAQNQDYVSEWSYMSMCQRCFSELAL